MVNLTVFPNYSNSQASEGEARQVDYFPTPWKMQNSSLIKIVTLQFSFSFNIMLHLTLVVLHDLQGLQRRNVTYLSRNGTAESISQHRPARVAKHEYLILSNEYYYHHSLQRSKFMNKGGGMTPTTPFSSQLKKKLQDFQRGMRQAWRD